MMLHINQFTYTFDFSNVLEFFLIILRIFGVHFQLNICKCVCTKNLIYDKWKYNWTTFGPIIP